MHSKSTGWAKDMMRCSLALSLEAGPKGAPVCADLCHIPELLCSLRFPDDEGPHPVVPIPLLLLVILGLVRIPHNQLPALR